MNKKSRLISLVLAAAVVVAACGGGPAESTENSTDPSPPTTQAEVLAATTTTAPATTTSLAPTTTSTTNAPDPDAEEIAAVYEIVFDSSTTFEEKAPLIDDPSGLEDTVATYAATGDSVGGVTAGVTSVEVDGDTAEIVYTLEFSGNPTYPGLNGSALRTEAGWQVSRDMFCGVMASARSACPSE